MVERANATNLIAAGAWATTTALLVRECCLLAGALVGVAALLRCLHRGRAGPELLAWIALLAAAARELPTAPQPPLGPVHFAGTVVEVRDTEAGSALVRLESAGQLLQLHVDDGGALQPGDLVRGVARVAPAVLAEGPPSIHVPRGGLTVRRGPPSLPALVRRLRRALEQQLRQRLPGEAGALLSMLVLANGPPLPPDLVAAHRGTGLSHLLAVSGAHMVMVAWLLGLSSFTGGLRPGAGRWRMRIGLFLLLVYGAVTGCEPPVFRALCAFLLLALGRHFGRPVGPVAALGVPALLTCIWAPAGLLTPSFLLSYAAVVGLALAGGPPSESALQRWLLEPLRASFWATACTAPVTLWFFGQLSPWTCLLTPLCAPLVALLLLGGLLCAALGLCLPMVADLLALLLQPGAWLYATVVRAADDLPGTPVFALATPAPWLLAASALFAIAAVAWRRNRRGALLACLCLCLPHFVPPPLPKQGHLCLFAIGHGQTAAATFADGGNLAVDCGSLQLPSLPGRKLAQAFAARVVDVLVLTHGDFDHTGALADVLQRLPVRHCVLPDELAAGKIGALLHSHGVATTGLQRGESCTPRPGLVVARPRGASSNDSCLWAHIDLGGVRVLMPGDAQEHGVTAAIAAGIAAPADVLVLPHHGRKNAMAAALLAAVQPRLCLVSNRGGEGRSAQGEVAAAAGIPVLATGEVGDLEVTAGPMPRAHAQYGAPLAPAPHH